MKVFKFLFFLLGLWICAYGVYAGPSSFTFIFHNLDPGKIVDIWMYDYPYGGVATNGKSQTISYKEQTDPVSIAQDPGKDDKDGIRGNWVVRIKNKDNTVYCAVVLNYKMQNEYGWKEKITFSKYANYDTCPHENLRWKKLPPPEGKPKHGTRFYKVNIYVNALHKIYCKD